MERTTRARSRVVANAATASSCVLAGLLGCQPPTPPATDVAPPPSADVPPPDASTQPPAHAAAPVAAIPGAAGSVAPAQAMPVGSRPDRLVPLADLFDRDPRGDLGCSAPFTSRWTRPPDATSTTALLAPAWWLDASAERGGPVIAPDDPKAPLARCYAAGPHRGLNLANWCCRPGDTERTVQPPLDPSPLAATLSVGRSVVAADRELVVAVAIVNRSTTPVVLDRTVAASPQLLLEVRNATGELVRTVPPPTPPATPDVETLPPNGGRTFQHRLGVFSPELPAGSYQLRVKLALNGAGSGIASGRLPFTIAPL